MARSDIRPTEGKPRPGMCGGKEAHESAAQAKKVVSNMRRFGKTVVAYRCPVCHAWHVGRPQKRLR